jgi:hypothetical protein
MEIRTDGNPDSHILLNSIDGCPLIDRIPGIVQAEFCSEIRASKRLIAKRMIGSYRAADSATF